MDWRERTYYWVRLNHNGLPLTYKNWDYEGKNYERRVKEELVIYTSNDGGGTVWARPASMWLETVERDGKSQPRFELMISDTSSKEVPAGEPNAPSKPYDLLYGEGGVGTT